MAGFEGAREAMETGLSAPAETSPASDNSNVDPVSGSENGSQSNTQEARQLIELDAVEKFKYKGRELSAKDLDAWEKGNMMQADYTKKTQAISEERKYYDNLSVDLAAVRDNPNLAGEFRKVYPEKYHGYLEFLGNRNNPQANQSQQQPEQRQALDPEIMSRLNKVDQMENYIREQEVKAVDAKLDVIFQKMSVKYPRADEERVLAMAQGLHNQGVKLDDAMWDKVWAQVNQKTEDSFKSWQKTLVTQQQEATKLARDAGGGGGTAGQAPNKPMTFKEATALALSDAQAQGLR